MVQYFELVNYCGRINLLAFYRECCSLVGYATHYLFCDKINSEECSTLNFRNFKVALNPMYGIFLNLVKSCILPCLSKFDIMKKFHRAVFEI